MLIGMGKLRVARATRCVVAFLLVLSLNLSTACLADDVYNAVLAAGNLSQEAVGHNAELHGDHSHAAQLHAHAHNDPHSTTVLVDDDYAHSHDFDDNGQCHDCEGHVHCCHAFLEVGEAPLSFPVTLKRTQDFAVTPILGLAGSTLLRPPRTDL